MTDNQGYRPPNAVVDELSSSQGRPIEPTGGVPVSGSDTWVRERFCVLPVVPAPRTLHHAITTAGPYDAILRQVEMLVTAPGGIARLALARALMRHEPGLADGASAYLDWSRLCYALHLLTGPALVLLRSSLLPVGSVTGVQIEAALNWRVFEQQLTYRWDVLNVLTMAPVPSLLRVTLFDAVHDMRSDRPGPLRSNVESAVRQFCEIDAAGTEMMLDLAVACLVPPIATKGGPNDQARPGR